jgi:anti-sigma B factor antagonist
MQLQIEHREMEPGVMVITLAGKLMLGKESSQIEELITQFMAEGRRHIIFDIAGVSRIDSTGIGRFIYSYNKIQEAGGSMGIAGASSHLRDAFHATRLDRIFKFYDDVSAARTALGTAGQEA